MHEYKFRKKQEKYNWNVCSGLWQWCKTACLTFFISKNVKPPLELIYSGKLWIHNTAIEFDMIFELLLLSIYDRLAKDAMLLYLMSLLCILAEIVVAVWGRVNGRDYRTFFTVKFE